MVGGGSGEMPGRLCDWASCRTRFDIPVDVRCKPTYRAALSRQLDGLRELSHSDEPVEAAPANSDATANVRAANDPLRHTGLQTKNARLQIAMRALTKSARPSRDNRAHQKQHTSMLSALDNQSLNPVAYQRVQCCVTASCSAKSTTPDPPR